VGNGSWTGSDDKESSLALQTAVNMVVISSTQPGLTKRESEGLLGELIRQTKGKNYLPQRKSSKKFPMASQTRIHTG